MQTGNSDFHPQTAPIKLTITPPKFYHIDKYIQFKPISNGRSVDIPKMQILQPLEFNKAKPKMHEKCVIRPLNKKEKQVPENKITPNLLLNIRQKIQEKCSSNGIKISETALKGIENIIFQKIFQLLRQIQGVTMNRVGKLIGPDRCITYAPYISAFNLSNEYLIITTARNEQFKNDPTIKEHVMPYPIIENAASKINDPSSLEFFYHKLSTMKSMENYHYRFNVDKEMKSQLGEDQLLNGINNKFIELKKDVEEQMRTPKNSNPVVLEEIKKTAEFEANKRHMVVIQKDVLFCLMESPEYEKYYRSLIMEVQVPKHK